MEEQLHPVCAQRPGWSPDVGCLVQRLVTGCHLAMAGGFMDRGARKALLEERAPGVHPACPMQ